MSIDAPVRPAPTLDGLAGRSVCFEPAHVHDRSCWWDVMACRWAGPAHPAPARRADVPAPRGAGDVVG